MPVRFDSPKLSFRTMNIGAVASLRNIKDAIAVARHVLENTQHTMLVGEQATEFAIQMGFKEESLSTPRSQQMHSEWRANNCQPNFWKNVIPNPAASCGPYAADSSEVLSKHSENDINSFFSSNNHDTIGMIVIDQKGDIAAGTSTNGANNKIPGRVGDSPIPGSGAYADNSVGAAAATGDGDILMRFLPSFLAVELLRNGNSPDVAGQKALMRIAQHYPLFVGAIVVADKDGNYGAACHGLDSFPFSVYSPQTKTVKVEKRDCLRSI